MESLGPYELLSPIGQGGMAEVWLARRSMAGGPGKLVAIKRMAAGLAAQDHYRAMFEAETRMSMTLNHSNIVQVFDYGTEQGDAYIVMELVDGVDLGSLISFAAETTGGTLPLNITTFLVGELLRALSYSHNLSISSASLGLIHRDVSPQNLLISKAGEVKLTDFGVARLVDENTSGAQPKGKLRYMAPEQMNGKGMDARVDLFAVGAILFELLAGKHFRDADSVDQLYGQILHPQTVRLPESVPPELASLTQDLLSPKADDRVTTAKEALKRLTAWSGYGDARDELAQLVRLCRPEALVIPPPPDRSSVGYASGSGPKAESAAAYAGHTQAMSAPAARSDAPGGQTLPNAVPEHTTMPDTTSASGSVVGFAGPRRTRTAIAVAGALALVGGTSVWMIRSSGSTPDKVVPSAAVASVAKSAKEAPLIKPAALQPTGASPDSLKDALQKLPGSAGALEATKGEATGDSVAGAPTKKKKGIVSRDRAGDSSTKGPETPRQKRRRELRELRRKRAEERRATAAAKLSKSSLPDPGDATKPARVTIKAHEFNYAYVKMAGKELLIEPLGTIRVPAGRHTIYVRETKADPWRSFGSMQLGPGDRAVVRLRRSGSVRISRSAP